MATYNKFQSWVKDKHESANCATDQFVVFLCASANAPVATNATLSQITQISYTNCSSRNLTTSSSSQTGGTYKLVLNDLTLTATGGNVGPFRYIGVYDDTPTSPADPLVCWWDYGADVTITDGNSFLVDLDGANGLFSAT